MDSAVENFLSVFEAVLGADAELSSRMKTILKPCLYTLATYENATIYDVLDFLDNEDNVKTQAWMERAKATLTNRAQLSTLESFFDNNYKTTKSALRDRLRTLL